MPGSGNPDSYTRRSFFKTATLGLAGVSLSMNEVAAIAAGSNPYAPFRMAVQSYSLRGYKLDEALDKTVALGLKYIEGFNGHFDVTTDPKKVAEYKEKLRAHGLTMPTFGVENFSSNEADCRHKFDFGKMMGIRTFSAYPSPDSFNLLDKLVDEYEINIAIHNHGPGDNLYYRWQMILDAIAGHNPRIGACDDTGHYLRSNEDPVKAAEMFGKRLYGCHLKNVKNGPNGEKQFTEIGDPAGLMDTNHLLSVLIQNRYSGILSLEYEEHADNPIPYMETCFTATRAAIKAVTSKPRE